MLDIAEIIYRLCPVRDMAILSHGHVIKTPATQTRRSQRLVQRVTHRLSPTHRRVPSDAFRRRTM